MEELVLSICVPVYNGGKRVYTNIKKILQSNDQRFEIVICDNGSIDGSIGLLRELVDERLHIHVNTQNIGPFRNGIKVLSMGSGKYLMLFLDRDILQIEYLSSYIDMLSVQQEGVILNSYAHAGLGDNRRLKQSADIAYWLTESPHPSFYVFLRKAFQEISITDWMKKDCYYPASCGLLISRTYGVMLQRRYPLVLEAENEYIYMNSSRTHAFAFEGKKDVIKNGAGFDEESVAIRFRNYVLFVKNEMGEFNSDVLLGIYRGNLKFILPGYFCVIKSSQLCHRYSIPDVKYASWEYKKLPFRFYRRAKHVIKEQGMWNLSLQWKMWRETWRCRRKFCREICN